ncbi:4Fe-4S dicluster domain-containing protein [Naumannella cuiyingiana]|uniref:Ferredoxin n=1 Tax=Naumannella cuiyingiana TaxID=1347891 RepID=A0A7Z0D7V5_9ACTN|nr:4Fe-4S dicluster domain-containing protein [Naumannella cuiyingiana]NYI70499.1 ferredoxin [Naumannella cuiyingiana]
MPYVITSPCQSSRDGACVDACPVDAIHPSEDEPQFGVHPQLYIDPLSCIECGACAPACPVEAIYAHEEVPDEQREYIEINAAHYHN